MSIINTKEVLAKIAHYEAQIDALKRLLEVGQMLEGGGKPVGRSPKAKPAAAKGGKRKRGKRGAVTEAIVALLENSKRPLSSGEIKKALEGQKVVAKGSATVYAMLLQMAKKGAITKSAGEGGTVYSSGTGIRPRKNASKKG
ncbi:MAG: hypothetical protein HZB29_13430 [Nitrospinae bacterium]|nr:hypothetical protein [Nitrospinota bacterium]